MQTPLGKQLCPWKHSESEFEREEKKIRVAWRGLQFCKAPGLSINIKRLQINNMCSYKRAQNSHVFSKVLNGIRTC